MYYTLHVFDLSVPVKINIKTFLLIVVFIAESQKKFWVVDFVA